MKQPFRLLLMLIVACVVLQACNTRRITRSRHDESRYNASRTDIHLQTDSTTSAGTETTTLIIEFDTGGTMTVPQGWFADIIDGMINDDTAAKPNDGKGLEQSVTLPRLKSIKASRTKRTEETALSKAADVVEADTTAERTTDADSTGTSVGATAITGKPPNRIAWWFAGVIFTILVAAGIYTWLTVRKNKN